MGDWTGDHGTLMKLTPAANARRILETSLGRFRSLTQCPDDETEWQKQKRVEVLTLQFTLALKIARELENTAVAQSLLHFEPLVRDPEREPERRDALRRELDLFIGQIVAMSTAEICGRKQGNN